MSENQRITAQNVDLSNCDRELIQYSNAVQPHAVLVVAHPEQGTILQVSANVAELGLGPVESWLGRTLEDLVVVVKKETLADLFQNLAENQPPQYVAHWPLPGGPRNIFIHKSGGLAYFEIERIAPGLFNSPTVLYSRLREGLGVLHRTESVQGVLDKTVELISHCTGFERVMAYKFLEDGSGHVVAEAVAPGLERYLGLHYPASDIPAPARRLFSLSWLRHLPDVGYTPVPVVPEINPHTGDTLDLSFAFSRSVSVMYTEYLKNMGVQATTVFTLMCNNKLWGLISCMHHSAPRHIPYEVRAACEILGHAVSLLLGTRGNAEDYRREQELEGFYLHLIESLGKTHSLRSTFIEAAGDVLGPLRAGGLALVIGGEVTTVGQTPPPDVIEQLCRHLAEEPNVVWATDHAVEALPMGEELREFGSGILAARIDRRRPDFLLWFRPEYIRTVNWAGDPNKPVDVTTVGGEQRLRPRGSFALWKVEVAGKSAPWTEAELDFVRNLRRSVVELVMEMAGREQELTKQVRLGRDEVQAYLALASHELKEPLRGISNFAQRIERSASARLTEEERGWVRVITGQARRMDGLIEGLLRYSQAAERPLHRETLDMSKICADVLRRLRPLILMHGAEVTIAPDFPALKADSAAVHEILVNLVENGIRFNQSSRRRVQIGWHGPQSPVLFVRDNGIGIAADQQDSVFRLFHQLHHRNEDFQAGPGMGLPIARRLAENLGGRMWLESGPESGTTFYFTVGH